MDVKERWLVEGLMPERALDRLQKAGIPLFKAKKIKKNGIVFHIMKKDMEKAFAIYPNMCYNNIRGSVYTFTRVGAPTTRERNVKRIRTLGILLGICVFLAFSLASTKLIFKVEFLGATVYKREVLAILKESDVQVFIIYEKGREEEFLPKILSLDGVEFCSVQKKGNTLRVEIRQTPLSQLKREQGDLIAPKNCVLQSAVALSGTTLKKVGDEIKEGDSIVGGFFINAEQSKTQTEVVAQAKLLCVEKILCEDKQSATAQAVLFVESMGGEICSIEMEKIENGVIATIKYTLVIKKNM